MYLPSVFFGGSSLIHLLASHPRVVALFGMSALIGTMLQSPFGTPSVMGTAAYIQHLEEVARQEGAIGSEALGRARMSARALAQLPSGNLAEIVEDTLRDCGSACVSVRTSEVVNNKDLLADVLFLRTLNQLNAPHSTTPQRPAVAP